MTSKVAKQLRDDIQELLEKGGFNLLQAPEVNEEDGRLIASVFIDEPRQLIGERGKNLNALQHIIRLIARNKYGDETVVDVDINGYKRKRMEFLRDMALSVRQRALKEHKDIEMEPMTAFDRRAVHSALTEYSDVETESTGEGFERRVVVKLRKT
ncbi:MAG: hypothetical protein A3H51_01055 [Candidatus Spechtbacteria bacterium RIFCSPLOWO2_02_FULL_38_8]|uniref:R3H domain-containing protein n=1 Tax=Candidatus Spechtbacteria bacterium RIFCSPLOWO2_02_FULL_38_8 TaxID=1802164 RepID=A0A1G2HKQ2_9BACT|nr:MAG: hypothetical protein A3H51_01055 [Candidatus Spechtbacteria bacterium RIFCSPLOWO2_02_FULL_38_8]